MLRGGHKGRQRHPATLMAPLRLPGPACPRKGNSGPGALLQPGPWPWVSAGRESFLLWGLTGAARGLLALCFIPSVPILADASHGQTGGGCEPSPCTVSPNTERLLLAVDLGLCNQTWRLQSCQTGQATPAQLMRKREQGFKAACDRNAEGAGGHRGSVSRWFGPGTGQGRSATIGNIQCAPLHPALHLTPRQHPSALPGD